MEYRKQVKIKLKEDRMIRRLLKWIFREELQSLNSQIQRSKDATENYETMEKILKNVLHNIDVSIDVYEYHRHAPSWAVISLQGQKTDYVRFVDLSDRSIYEIERFLSQFERLENVKVDASPQASGFLRIPRNKRF